MTRMIKVLSMAIMVMVPRFMDPSSEVNPSPRFDQSPKLLPSLRLREALGSKIQENCIGCQIPESKQVELTWETFSGRKRNEHHPYNEYKKWE